jgi:hypothetical protein
MMNPPEGTVIYEGELASFWIDENGILCARGKYTSRSLEKQEANYEFIRKITGDKPVCLLSDTTSSPPMDRATREYIASEMPKVFKAMAVISETPLGRMVANAFLAINRDPIPIKMFDNEKEAKEWLKQYL